MFVIYNRQKSTYYAGTISAFVPGTNQMLTPDTVEAVEGAQQFETFAGAKKWRDDTLQPHLHRHLEIVALCCVCDTPLSIPEGYADSGMCGPCCTGEADTISEKGETW